MVIPEQPGLFCVHRQKEGEVEPASVEIPKPGAKVNQCGDCAVSSASCSAISGQDLIPAQLVAPPEAHAVLLEEGAFTEWTIDQAAKAKHQALADQGLPQGELCGEASGEYLSVLRRGEGESSGRFTSCASIGERPSIGGVQLHAEEQIAVLKT